ncbi:poliovirus receptor homolog [Castor canadensis]|uniref:poliovirus receptor homolog n=1 Tax=Castor canadensis TaxID=51338 RepID=UPI003D1647DD
MAGALLLLLLLLLLALTGGSGTRPMDVKVLSQVIGFVGESVTLPCHLQLVESTLEVTQITWMREEPEDTVAVFHPKQGATYPDPKRTRFAAYRQGMDPQDMDVWDASLILAEVRAEDEANYTCTFATYPMGSRSARTQLRVLARPQSTAKALAVPLSPLPSEPVPVARCVSTGGLPPAEISWLSHENIPTNETKDPGGTYTVTSFFTLVPSSQDDGKNVTCKVQHESLKEPVLLPVTLALHYPPEVSITGYDDNWYLGRRNVALTCHAHSNPKSESYNWSTPTGPLPHSAVAQNNKLFIHTVDESVNTTFICSVTNALGTRQEEMAIQVKKTLSGTDRRTVITIAIVLVIIAVIVGGLGFCCVRQRRHRGQQQSSPSANGAVHYSLVNTGEVNSPQDQPTRSTR